MKKMDEHGSSRVLLIVIFIISVFGILVGAYTYYRHEVSSIEQEKYEDLAFISQLKTKHIVEWRNERIREAMWSATRPVFVKNLEALLKNPDNSELRKMQLNVISREQQTQGYDQLIILEPTGNVVISAPPNPEPLAPEEAQTVAEALATKSVKISELYASPKGQVQFDVVAPVLDHGQVIALMVRRDNAARQLQPLIETWPTRSKTAETVLVRKDNGDVLFLNELRHRKNTALSLRQPIANTDVPVVQAVLGKEGMFRGKDYRGVDVLADLRPISDSPWFMVAKIDSDEILEEARYRGAVVAAFSIVCVLVAGIIIAYSYKKRQTALFRDLYQSEKQQREAEEIFRTTLYSIGDGVITTDANAKVQFMNSPAERLTGWVESEAHGKTLGEILQLVNEDSRESVEIPSQSALGSGKAVQQSNRALLIARDGTDRPITYTAAPIHNADGAVLGSVLIIHDETQDRAIQKTLEHSEQSLRNLIEHLPQRIFLKDRNSVYLSCNKNYASDLGITPEQIVGKDDYAFHPKELAQAYRDDDHACMETGLVKNIRERYQLGDQERWIHTIKVPYYDRRGEIIGVLGIFEDITESKDADDALRASQEKYSRIINTSKEGICSLDERLNIAFCNQRFADMVGYPLQELLGKPVDLLIFEEDREDYKKEMWGQPDGELDSYERRLRRRDGGVIWAVISATPLFDDQKRFQGTFGMFTDISRLKETEQSLRQSQAHLESEKDKLKSILDNMKDGVYMVNAHYEIEYINPVIASDYGEVAGRKCYEYFHDRSESCPWCTNQRVFAGESVQWERYSEKTGKTYELFDTPVRNADGTQSKLEIFHDVTDKKNAEDALIKSEERFRDVAESTSDMIWEVDKEGMFTYCTSASERILGYSVEEMVGEKFFYDFFVPELREMMKRKALEAFESKEPFRDFINPNVRRNGQIVILETSGSPVIDEKGNLIGYRGADTDVTERYQAQEAQLRLIAAIEQTAEGVVIMDSHGTVEYVNSGYEQITGCSREEVLGTKHHFFEEDEHGEPLNSLVRDTVVEGSSWSGRLVRTRKNGETYTEDVRMSPVRSSSGTIVNYVAIKRDVSQELNIQQQLLQSQKMEAVGTLAAGIAHDFNNILQVVLGYSELLLAGRQKTDDEFGSLGKINSASRRGADLVQNLMMFSRKVEPNLKLLNLNDEVAQIQKLLSRTIPKDIKITVHLSGDLHVVEADISQMGQVLMNLAVNARDAMPDGGKLNFETSNVDLDERYCAAHPDFQPGTYALLTVWDTGIGMAPETLSHVFEPFFTTKASGHGTGLGLATVFGIIKQHRGQITCESQVGKGTTFRIYLPAVERQLDDETQESTAPIVGGTETILLVDDEESLRDLGATILARYGYQVVTAANGREALESYEKGNEKISLVVLDLIMPEMDGKKCLAEILNINPNAKVLIASGYSETSPSMPRLPPGAKGLVAKPYEMRALLQAVREALDAGR